MAPKKKKEAETPERGEKSVEEKYRKLSQREHVLQRPDTYVGSPAMQDAECYVYEEGELVCRSIRYAPALYKIFDEILVNAADNSMRDAKGMTKIEIEIDAEEGFISVLNDGENIPIKVHKEYDCWVPEMLFGQLLTSDNYDDSEKKVTGGRNGFGAKLTNIFSTRFEIETAGFEAGKNEGKKSKRMKYFQYFTDNMLAKGEPVVEKDYAGPQYTRIKFWPDFKKFGMKGFDKDTLALFQKRSFDIAATTAKTVRVTLNGEELNVQNFEDYVKFIVHGGEGKETAAEEKTYYYTQAGPRWEIAVLPDTDGLPHVSHVNSICTSKGGTHVNYVTDAICDAIIKKLSGEKFSKKLGKTFIRNHFRVIMNCKIENPAFDSQTKDALTTNSKTWGSQPELSKAFMNQVCSGPIIDTIFSEMSYKYTQAMGKMGAQKGRISVPKLEDAHKAGTKDAHRCTLILTEGDSAKALAVAGLSVIGRDHYGVFPLKGKVMNVREASQQQVTKNAEISNILKIMGFDLRKSYTSVEGLRYGSIMIMTDQDHDGSHIKGLILNMLHQWFPDLLKVEGFLKEFATPIVKVTKGSETKSFFTQSEYNLWERTERVGAWKSKYYKGLGTNTNAEAKQYFSDLKAHQLRFTARDPEDFESIPLAFSAQRADDRKEWINSVDDDVCVDHGADEVSISDFVNKELVHFSKYDCSRALPSVIDGLKPGQRKVLYAAFKRRLTQDAKVAQFCGYVAEHAAYHHGEVSLEQTIVKMAQNYIGSNNVNLFVPSGQFGSRAEGGEDSAATRYIYTRLSPITRLLFPVDDDNVLLNLEEEGHVIEPKWYCPVIPTVLVNGALGIGTGYSTQCPKYNPLDLIANVRRFLADEPFEDMAPWFRGFSGTIRGSTKTTASKWESVGTYVITKSGDLIIDELPVKTKTSSYKSKVLEPLCADGSIKGFTENHGVNKILFQIELGPELKKKAKEFLQTKEGNFDEKLEKTFKLVSPLTTDLMFFFDSQQKIRKYESVCDIMEEFCEVRLQVYKKRKEDKVTRLRREVESLRNKVDFLQAVLDKVLDLTAGESQVDTQLRANGFMTEGQLEAISNNQDPAKCGDDSNYNYLLNLPIRSLTAEKLGDLKSNFEKKKADMEELKAKTLAELWEEDLQAVEESLEQSNKAFEQELDLEVQTIRKGAEKALNAGASAPALASKAKKATKAKAVETKAKAVETKAKASSKVPVTTKESLLTRSALSSRCASVAVARRGLFIGASAMQLRPHASHVRRGATWSWGCRAALAAAVSRAGLSWGAAAPAQGGSQRSVGLPVQPGLFGRVRPGIRPDVAAPALLRAALSRQTLRVR